MSSFVTKIKQMNTSDLIKQMVTDGQIPQFIYRYRSFNNYTKDIFKNNELWFSNPVDFNDPFDCQINIDTNNSRGEIKTYFEKLIKETGQTFDVDNNVELYYNDKDKLHELVNTAKNNAFGNMGICCFSSCWDDILMWSHYCNSHAGFVMMFDVLEDMDFFSLPFNVIYSNQYPEYNHFKDDKSLANKLILTKYSSWEYEKEIRIHKTGTGNYKFNKNALKEVIVGTKCSNDDLKNLIDILNEHSYNTQVSKASTDVSQYKLSKKPV